MKRNSFYREIFSLCLLLIITGSCLAQKLRLNGYGAYVLDGSYHIYYPNGDFYKGTINHGPQLGFGMEYMVMPRHGVELSYLRQNTSVFPEGPANSGSRSADLRFDYFLVGLNAYPQIRPRRLQPYGGVSAGVIIQTASNMLDITDYPVRHSITKFAWATKLGGIFWLAKQVGIKLQAQWLSALQVQNAAVNFDVHRLNGVQAESAIANQFAFGSGFVVKLGKSKI